MSSVVAEVRVDPAGRLFLCARCRAQVVLCSRCDRGNRYCGSTCRRQARDAARRESANRYQCSYRGRLAHAARSRRWRQRHADRTQNVTHQGSQPGTADAPLVAWTRDTTAGIVTARPADSAPAQNVGPPDSSRPCNPCRRCAAPLGLWVRQGFLRHSHRVVAAEARRHDHSP